MLVDILIGLLLAALGVLLGRYYIPKRDILFWRNGLVIAALIYIAFAIIGSAWDFLLLEFIGLIIYGTFAFLAVRHHLLWLAAGWGLHIIWDLYLHAGPDTTFVPAWYPGLCLGFDIIIAAYVFYCWYAPVPDH